MVATLEKEFPPIAFPAIHAEEHMSLYIEEVTEGRVRLTQQDFDDIYWLHSQLVAYRQRQTANLVHSPVITSIVHVRIENGKNVGGFLGSIVGVGVSIATGQWWAAGLSLVSGVLGLFNQPEERKAEERLDEQGGFGSSGQLAPIGAPLPKIYCNGEINPNGGVRLGGYNAVTQVHVHGGVAYLEQLFIVASGDNSGLGWGQLGEIDPEETLFDLQPRRIYGTDITTYVRLGTPNQTPIQQFQYYSQNVAPRDYASLGVDLVAKVKETGNVQNPNPSTVGVVYSNNDTTVTKTDPNNAWNAGAFGEVGITSPGVITFSTPTGVAAVGLSTIDQDQNWVSIRNGFLFDVDSNYYVVENGNRLTLPVPYVAGSPNTFSIEYTATQVIYRVDGATVYVSTLAPTFPVYPDIAIFDTGAAVNNVNVNGATLGQSFTTGATLVPGPTQDDEEDDAELKVLDLFDAAKEFTVQATGETYTDPSFKVVNKDTPTRTITTSDPINAPSGSNIFRFSHAIYETTRGVNRFDLILEATLHAVHAGEPEDKNNGKSVIHGVLFDVYIREAETPRTANQFVIRCLIKNSNPGRIVRQLRLMDLPFGRYVVELWPLTAVSTANPQEIWELNDNVYQSNTAYDAEDKPTTQSDAAFAGNQVRVMSEMQRAFSGTTINEGLFGTGSTIQYAGTYGSLVSTDPNGETAVALDPTPGNTEYTVRIPTNFQQFGGDPVLYGLTTLGSTTVLYGWQVQRDPLTLQLVATPIDEGVLGAPLVTYGGTTLEYGVSGDQVFLNDQSGNVTGFPHQITPPTPSVLYHSVTVPDDTVYPAPIPTVNYGDGIYSVDQVNKWIGFDDKAQVTSQSGPTVKISSVNEIVYPGTVEYPNNGQIPTYAGLSVVGHRFVWSERIQTAPASRLYVRKGSVCPNWVAAGTSTIGSARTIGGVCAPIQVGPNEYAVLTDATADFIAAGIQPGYVLRNLTQGIESRIVTVTPTALTTELPMCFDGESFCADQYAVYFLESTPYFPDVLIDLLRSELGHLLPVDQLIDFPSFVEAREFCEASGYFIDVTLSKQTPFSQWVLDNARQSGLYPASFDGKLALTPDNPRQPRATLNSSNCRNITITYPQYEQSDVNTLQLEYTDGRITNEAGQRHRADTIIIQTAAAYNATEPTVIEKVNARNVTNPDTQLVAIGGLYLKVMRTSNVTIGFEANWEISEIRAGDVICAQSKVTDGSKEFSGVVKSVERTGTTDRITLNTDFVVRKSFVTQANPNGAFGVISESSKIVPGDILHNRTTNTFGAITAVTADSYLAPVAFSEGDDYAVLATQLPTGYNAVVTYRETGDTEILPVTLAFNGAKVEALISGATQEIQVFDKVNIGPASNFYKVNRINLADRASFEVEASQYDADIYNLTGLVSIINNEVTIY